MEAIRVYRGLPNARLEPELSGVNQRQANTWSRRDKRVHMEQRPLVYRDWPKPPTEKGIDVKLAVDAIYLAMRRLYDAMIIFSSDTDLMPAVELVQSMATTRIEVACWEAANPLQDHATHRPYCHFLTEGDWRRVIRDWTNR